MSWPPPVRTSLCGEPDPAVGAFSFPTRQAKRSRSAARPQKQKRPTRLPGARHGAGERGMIMPIVATAYQRQIPHARQAARQELVRSVQEGMTAREARRCCSVQIHRTTVYRLRVSGSSAKASRPWLSGDMVTPSNYVERCSPFCWTTARVILLFPAQKSNTCWPNDLRSRSA